MRGRNAWLSAFPDDQAGGHHHHALARSQGRALDLPVQQAEGSLGEMTAAWTYHQLPPHCRRFLAHIPMTHRAGNLLLVHASAHQPDDWRYVDNERAAQQCLDAATEQVAQSQVFVGHVHHQTLYYQGAGRGLMAFKPTPGAAVPIPRHRACVVTVG